ncbi:MAG: response regulator [Lachnospiraceae bacterium]|nr:response regulator [Candidatus Colinaster scatohippi]
MRFDVHYAIAGLVIYILVLFSLCVQYDNKQNSVIKLRQLIECLFMADLFDIISAYTIAYVDRFPIWTNYVTNTAFFLFETSCMALLPRYIRYLLDPENGKKCLFDNINLGVVIVYGITCVTTFCTKLVFYFDGTAFRKGPLYNVAYILGIYFMLYSFVRLMQYKSSFSKRQFYTIVGFILMTVLGSIFQFMVPGSVFVLYFIFSIASYITLFGLETPDYIKLEKAMLELKRSERQLQDAVKKAEAADEAKSVFLANMSHEIRTPINAVLGMNELISREATDENIRNYSDDIADAGQSLLSLINDILDFSKIEAGQMELSNTDYELSTLIREVNNIIKHRFEEKGLAFEIKNNPEIPNGLYGDDVRIRQILFNLLSNALKYTDKGMVTLDVDYNKIDEENIELVFTVSDTGVGIKEADKESLFISFKRINMENNRKREGTGLGLNITKTLVEMMHGYIDVKSEYGKGSVFTVHIRQEVRDRSAIGDFANAASGKKEHKYSSAFKAPEAKILVVDDVATNLLIMKGLLKKTEIIVETAQSGVDCLKLVREKKYDLIFLDHMMPDMDGIETIRAIKADTGHYNQDTPIIMLTANAISGAKEQYLGDGFADYLSKPIDWQELENMIMNMLPEKLVIRQ